MAKDPAFLFYSDNFQSGTQFLSDEQLGKYIRLLCAQHLHGHLSEKQMLHICKERDDAIWEKFKKDSDGKYYQERLDIEIAKRKSFSESRRNNRNKLNNESLHIYFIKNNSNGFVKIGSSVDVDRRFLELNKQYGGTLELLFASGKCSQKKETEFHETYKHKREFNEWYSLSESDLKELKSHIIKHIGIHMINHMGNEIGNGNGIGIGIEMFDSIKLNFFNDFRWKEKFCRDKKIEMSLLEQKMQEFISDTELREDYKKLSDLKSHFTNTFNKNRNGKQGNKPGTSEARIEAAKKW